MNAILEQINTIEKSFVEFALPMLAQFSILFLILLLIDFLLRKKVRSVFRYWIWMLVLAKLVLPTSLSSPLSLGYLFGDRLTSLQVAPIAPQPKEQAPAISPQLIEFSNITPAVDTPRVVMPPVTEPVPTQPVSPQYPPTTPLSWQGVVFLLWLAVVIAMGLLLLQRAVFVAGLVAQATEADISIKDTFNSCLERIEVTRRIGLKVSANATSPAVCGLFRPVVLLPHNLASSLDSNQLRAVLLHELAHIKRGDLWVNLVQTILQIVYFYNPLLWIANAIIRRIREQAVDEMVLVTMGQNAKQYPQTLVSVAKLSFKRPALSLPLIGVVESKSALSSRIKRILTRPIPKNTKLGIFGLLSLIVIAAILLPMAKAKEGKKEAQPKMGFVATLPNGVKVELVGLLRLAERGIEAWKPDGEPTVIKGVFESDIDGRGTVAAFKVQGLNVEVQAYSWQGSNTVRLKDTSYLPSGDIWLGAFDYPADRRFGNLLLKVGQWKAIFTIPVTEEEMSKEQAILTENFKNFAVTRIGKLRRLPEGCFSIEITHGIYIRLDEEFLALDKSGKLHEPIAIMLFSREGKEGREEGSILTFKFPAEELAGIARCQQDWGEVRFRNVSLQPGVKTDVQIEFEKAAVQVQVVDAFGEVVETVIYSSEIGKDFFFDLDRNEAFTPPSYLTRSSPPEEVIEWSLKYGIDFLNDKGRFEITPQTIFVKVANNLWYGSAEDVLDTLKTGYPEEVIPDYETVPPGLQFSQSRGDEPKTYVFETREGGIGLLQLLESKNGNVKIRYKMLKQQSAKNLAILTDKPPVVLDLDSGKLMRLDKDWPDEYDVSWDNDAGGSLFTKPDGLVNMLPILEAENFADALAIAAQKIESLKVRGVHGIFAGQCRYILIKTSQGNIAVVEVQEFDEGKANIRWQIIQQAIEKPDVQVEGEKAKSELEGKLIQGFRENRDKFECGVLAWSGKSVNYSYSDSNDPRRELAGQHELWWDGKKIATKYVQDQVYTDPTGRFWVDKQQGGNSYDGSLLSRKPRFNYHENWFGPTITRWRGQGSRDWLILEGNKRENIRKEWSVVDTNGVKLIRLMTKNMNETDTDYRAYSIEHYDPSKGYGIVNEEWYNSDGSPRMKHTVKLQEVIPGGWFPVKVDFKSFAITDGRVYEHQHYELDIERCSFNDRAAIPKGIFKGAINKQLKEQDKLTKVLEEFPEVKRIDGLSEPDRKERDARETAETFVAMALAGEYQKAREFTHHTLPDDHIKDIHEAAEGQNLKVMAVYTDAQSGLAICSVIRDERGRMGPLVLHMVKVISDGKENWSIHDIDMITAEETRKVLGKFLKEHLDAVMIAGQKTDVQVEGESQEDLNKKIEELIGILKDFEVGDREKWFSAVKELIEIGSPAVKPLSIEIRTAERPQTQSVIAFTLRAIGDSNAVPALIDALERSGFSSDYGVGKADTELSRFIRRYQVNPSADGVRLCRPVREITIALERLTDHTEGHEHFITIGDVITPELRDLERAQYREVAQRWRQWWQQQKKAKESGPRVLAASEGSLLEFHIVLDNSQGEWLGLTPEDISKYKGSLSTEGPFAGSIRGEAYQWYSIKEDLRIQPGFIVQEYKGKKYLLFCARQKHSIWPPIGTDRSWGLQKVYAIKDSNGRPAIGFEFDKRGGELFYELTKGNIGKTLAVIIDGEVVSTPMIMSPLQNEGTVVGDFTQQEVERMVEALRKGMPPVKPDVQVEVKQSDKTSESSGGEPRVQEPNEARGRIRGVVVNAVTGQPIEGVYVGVGDFGDSGGSNYSRHRSQGFFAKSETDPNGRFELDGLAYSDEHPEYDLHPLVVTHPDFVRYDEKIKLIKGKPAPDVRIGLKPATKINVTIVDSDGKPLEGLWLFRLEALDGRYFIPPGRDPHLSAFASSVWIERPSPKRDKLLTTGFSFTGLTGGEYSIDVMQFAIIDNFSPPPSEMGRLPLDSCNITYYGGITKLNVEASETKEVQIKPADYQTSVIIKMPEDPVKKPQIPPFVVISRNVGLLAWDDGKAHGPEDERLGRLEKNALYYNTVIDGNVLKIKNLPPGSYSVFAGPIYFMSATKMEVLGGREATVDILPIKVSEHAKVGLWTFNRKVKPEARDYSVSELCQLISAKTDSNPRLIPDPSIENQKIKLTEKEMSIWDVLEMIYLDKGWKVKEGGEKTLILQP